MPSKKEKIFCISNHNEKNKSLKIDPEVWKDFVKRLGIKEENSSFVNIAKLFYRKLDEETPYIGLNLNGGFKLDGLKDVQMDNYEGDLLVIDLDFVDSSKMADFKEKARDFYRIVNYFEKLYKDYGLKVFFSEGDRIMIGFFSEKDLNSKIQIVKILISLLRYILNINFHVRFFQYIKKKNEALLSVFSSNIQNTVISEELNKKFKQLGRFENDFIEMNILLDLLGINRSIKGLEEIGINSLEEFDYIVSNRKTGRIIKTQIDYLIENFNDSEFVRQALLIFLFKFLVKNEKIKIENLVEEFKPGDVIINYGSLKPDFYIILEGDLEIILFGDERNKLIVHGKNIIGEMSLTDGIAKATVRSKSKVKAIRIPRSYIEWLMNYDKKVARLIEKFSKYRYRVDVMKDSVLKEFITKYGDILEKSNNAYLKKLLFDGLEIIESEKCNLTKEDQEVDKLFLIQKGSKVKIVKQGRIYVETLAEDLIIGEGSFLSFIEREEYGKASATVSLIKGSYKQISFEKAKQRIENDINGKFIIEFLKLLDKYRRDKVVIVNLAA